MGPPRGLFPILHQKLLCTRNCAKGTLIRQERYNSELDHRVSMKARVDMGMVKAALVLLLSSFMLVACGSPEPVRDSRPGAAGTEISTRAIDSRQPPPNFDFVFSYGSCITVQVDTFQDRLTRVVEQEREIIPFSLNGREKAMIYSKMLEIGFFAFPEHFSIPTPESGTMGVVTPADTYGFRVRSGATTKEPHWTDEIVDPNTPEADKLRQLVKLMERIIAAQPEMKKLRELNVGCA